MTNLNHEWKKRELQMKVVQGLFFISEEAWVGENGSI